MWPDRTDEVGAFLLFLRLALTVARVRWNNEIIRELCKAEACEIAPGQGIGKLAVTESFSSTEFLPSDSPGRHQFLMQVKIFKLNRMPVLNGIFAIDRLMSFILYVCMYLSVL